MKVKTLVIGDTHGLFPVMEELMETVYLRGGHKFDRVIQLGDFGCYPNAPNKYTHPCSIIPGIDVPKYFIRGNHEDHEFLSLHYHKDAPLALESYPGWSYVPDAVHFDGTYFIGGAWSIDASHRNSLAHPFRWHHNEQIDQDHINKILDDFSNPDVVKSLHTIITHDAPMSLYEPIVGRLLSWADYKTPRLFDRLVELLNEPQYDSLPEINWCFGHLGKSHMNRSAPRDGTPRHFKKGRVNFFLLDMIMDYADIDKQCDAWMILTHES